MWITHLLVKCITNFVLASYVIFNHSSLYFHSLLLPVFLCDLLYPLGIFYKMATILHCSNKLLILHCKQTKNTKTPWWLSEPFEIFIAFLLWLNYQRHLQHSGYYWCDKRSCACLCVMQSFRMIVTYEKTPMYILLTSVRLVDIQHTSHVSDVVADLIIIQDTWEFICLNTV